jgi:hypothetical protein
VRLRIQNSNRVAELNAVQYVAQVLFRQTAHLHKHRFLEHLPARVAPPPRARCAGGPGGQCNARGQRCLARHLQHAAVAFAFPATAAALLFDFRDHLSQRAPRTASGNKGVVAAVALRHQSVIRTSQAVSVTVHPTDQGPRTSMLYLPRVAMRRFEIVLFGFMALRRAQHPDVRPLRGGHSWVAEGPSAGKSENAGVRNALAAAPRNTAHRLELRDGAGGTRISWHEGREACTLAPCALLVSRPRAWCTGHAPPDVQRSPPTWTSRSSNKLTPCSQSRSGP